MLMSMIVTLVNDCFEEIGSVAQFFPLDKFRNGVVTTPQQYTPKPASDQAGKSADVNTNRRLHESWNYYDRCYNRERNKGRL